MDIKIDFSLCTRCGRCDSVCVADIFRANVGGIPLLQEQNVKNCTHCGQCSAVCPAAAITLDGVAPETLQPIVDAPLSEIQLDMLFSGRRSIRNYKTDAVPQELLARALKLAANAPTAHHVRDVCWTIINGREKLASLLSQAADVLENSGKPQYAGLIQSVRAGQDPIFLGAPCLILVHCDPWLWGEADCSIAASHMELALHSLGLGTCWSGMLVNAARIDRKAGVPLNKIGDGRSWRSTVIDAALHPSSLSSLNLSIPEGHRLYAALLTGYPAFDYARIPQRTPAEVTWL